MSMSKISLFVLVCGLLGAGGAFAAQDESYNGSQCTGVFGADAANFTRSEFGTQNLSNSKVVWVTCSISRENDESQQDAFVTFFATSGTTCYFNVQYTANLIQFVDSATASGPLAATVLGAEIDWSNFSSVALTCSIRPGGTLASYHYEEGFV